MEKEIMYQKDSKRLIGVVFSLIFIGGIYVVYETLFREFAEYRFTIATVDGRYRGKSSGITYYYVVDGIQMRAKCIYNDCKKLRLGTRCVVKYYVDKPDWTELFPAAIVPPTKRTSKWLDGISIFLDSSKSPSP